jgi:hypothetical protein
MLFARFSAVLCALLLFMPALNAQVLYGTLIGDVLDPSQAAVPKATVSVSNKATGLTRDATTDDRGHYEFQSLPAGTYDLKVTAPGFVAYTQTGIDVTINTLSRVDVQLRVGSLNETVTVSAEVATLQTDRSDVRNEIGAKQVSNLPLSGYRNYQSLINLMPGATPARFQNAITDTPLRGLTTNINGTARNSNNTRIDGATSVFTWLPHHVLYIPPAESIDTVNISTSNFDAEQGLAGGAAVTVSTKSGTNNFHGAVFEYYNNQILQAKNFFFLDPRTPKSIQHQYGAAGGGPIQRDKLFFFASWEGIRQRQNFGRIQTVATAPERDGNFSGIPNLTIYDPETGTPDGRNRMPFGNNTIPMARQSAIARKIQALVPQPNQPGLANNFFASKPLSYDRDSLDVKINWNISSKTTMFGKYSIMRSPVSAEGVLGEAIGPSAVPGTGAGVGTGHNRTQVFGFGITHTVSPSMVIDGNFGGSRLHHNTEGPDFGKNIGSDVLGIPGTNGPDPRQSGFPIFDVNGYETMGNPNNWSPVERNDRVYTYVANASWTKGAHNIRFGLDWINHQMNHWQPEFGSYSPRGRFNFNGNITALNGGAATRQQNRWADFLLGLPSQMGKALQFYDPMRTREWQYGYFFRDQWQVTRRFSATLGLRYEYYPIMSRGEFGLERYDPETNKVLLGGRGSVPRNAGTTTSKTMFAPRVGFAYRLGDKTVIRGGYGITYDPYPLSRPLRSPFPAVIVNEYFGATSYQAAGKLETGLPPFQTVDVSKGIVDIPNSVSTNSLFGGQFRRGYIQSLNFTVQRQLWAGFTGQAGYVGTRTIRQALSFFNINAGVIPGAGQNGRPLFGRFQRAVDTNIFLPFGTSNYNSLQVKLDRRFSGGLFWTSSYTYSKTIALNDNSDNSLAIYIPSDMYRNRAVAGFDRTHIFNTAAIWELPFGKGKKYLTDRSVGSAVLGGWQLNANFASYTGIPYTVCGPGGSLNAPGNFVSSSYAGFGSNNFTGSCGNLADQVTAASDKLGGDGSGLPFFDGTAFRAVTQTRVGTAGRNSLRGPGVVNLDLSLFRTFPITERFKLEFRAESFNFTNTPHFANPNGDVSSSAYTFITATTDQDQRLFRFALRLSF